MFSFKNTIWAISGMMMLFFIGCGKKKDQGMQGPPPSPVVDVIVAMPSKFEETFEANGSVVANESAELHPEISGRLTFLDMPDGAKVSKGKILARVNDADLQGQIAKIKAQLDLAIKNEERLKNLLAVNGVNQADYDLALNQLNNLKADLTILQAQIDKTVVKAPFDGKLGLRVVSLGSYVTPQTILGNLQQVDKLKIDFTIPEEYARLVKLGTIVNVKLNDSKEFRKAKISAIEPQLNLSTRNLKIRALLVGAGVVPGTFVKIVFFVGGDKSRFVVPTNAIIPDAMAKKLVVIKRDSANFVNVETGARTAGGVEITSGINLGDSVVVTGTLFVRPKQRVKIRSVKNLETLLK